jgi:signal transduction histidine kinase
VPASVLIVEDEEAVAFTLREILAQEGYAVQDVHTTAEALAKLDHERFDVAVLDLRVGEDSGLTVLARLREVSPATIALILTGYGSLETAIEAMRNGAFDYLLKPCDVQELKAAIARGLEQRQVAGPPVDGSASADTARVELEAALARAARARDAFLTVAGHELKTPLSSVIGWAQYVQRQLARGAADEAVEKLDVVVDQARRLARLVEAFLEVVRIQHGAVSMASDRLDLRQLLDRATREATRLAPRHEVRLEVPDQPVVVLGDATRLGQAVAYLLENSVKFSPQGGRVTVNISVAADEARIAIQDEGIGISADEIPQLFERFHQIDNDVMTRRFGGIGVGLYLCRALVEAHGGRVWAESPGTQQGSTFTIALPLAPPRALGGSSASYPFAGRPAGNRQRRGIRGAHRGGWAWLDAPPRRGGAELDRDPSRLRGDRLGNPTEFRWRGRGLGSPDRDVRRRLPAAPTPPGRGQPHAALPEPAHRAGPQILAATAPARGALSYVGPVRMVPASAIAHDAPLLSQRLCDSHQLLRRACRGAAVDGQAARPWTAFRRGLAVGSRRRPRHPAGRATEQSSGVELALAQRCRWGSAPRDHPGGGYLVARHRAGGRA